MATSTDFFFLWKEFLGGANWQKASSLVAISFSSLVFADDVVLLALSGSGLQLPLEHFAAKCEGLGIRISTSKSEVMVPSRKRVMSPFQVRGKLFLQVCSSSLSSSILVLVHR